MICPYCKLEVRVESSEGNTTVLHATPPCMMFQRCEADSFLTYVRRNQPKVYGGSMVAKVIGRTRKGYSS
jgi:Zn-finger nucleic acid-binding protein